MDWSIESHASCLSLSFCIFVFFCEKCCSETPTNSIPTAHDKITFCTDSTSMSSGDPLAKLWLGNTNAIHMRTAYKKI